MNASSMRAHLPRGLPINLAAGGIHHMQRLPKRRAARRQDHGERGLAAGQGAVIGHLQGA